MDGIQRQPWSWGVGARLSGFLAGLLHRWQQAAARRPQRSLRLCETLSLGEKRFLAVVEVNQEHFLVGGAGNSIALLTPLPASAALPAEKNRPRPQPNGVLRGNARK